MFAMALDAYPQENCISNCCMLFVEQGNANGAYARLDVALTQLRGVDSSVQSDRACRLFMGHLDFILFTYAMTANMRNDFKTADKMMNELLALSPHSSAAWELRLNIFENKHEQNPKHLKQKQKNISCIYKIGSSWGPMGPQVLYIQFLFLCF